MSRVYIVEDEALVAMMLEDMVVELGHEVVGIGARLDTGLAAAQTVGCDLAILDINLNGLMSFPIAHALAERGIPFFFASGYGAAGLDESLSAVPILSKPFSMGQLEQIIRQRLTP